MSFCHLHNHNEYSLLDGVGKAEHFIDRAIELDQEYLGLTNHGNIDGLIKFQKEADKKRINPVMGCEFYIVEDAMIKVKGEKRHHITILIKNEKGWKSVCNLLNYANEIGFYYRPRIDPDILMKNLDGIIVMSACWASFIKADWGDELLEDLNEDGVDLYLEVMPHIEDAQKKVNRLCLDYSGEYNIPLVATNDAHYPKKGDWRTQEVLLAIGTGAKMSDANRFKFNLKGLHLRSEEEMLKTFLKQGVLSRSQIINCIERTIEPAIKCKDFRIKKREIDLPDLEGIKDPDRALYYLCGTAIDKMGLDRRKKFQYMKRLNEEYQLISKKKFSAYFLVVKDIIDMCAKKGIMKGPGRGSVGCSLIANLLGITMIDPLKHRLPFSRFINEDRIDVPDIDMDFEDGRVDEIKAYLEDKYGFGNVFGVSTFMKMKSRLAIKDVARVFEVPSEDVNEFSKILHFKYGDDDESHILHAVEETEEGRNFKENYPDVIDFALKLEGQVRNAGKHPAAVVICDKHLHERAILTMRSKSLVCNWDMDDLEYMGLLKIDILSLNTMTVLKETILSIYENHGKKIKYWEIPFGDKNIFQDMSDSKVTGIFQISGWATMTVIKDVGIDNFQHISDCVALSRPGPKDSGMTADYIERKHSGFWERKHPIYERITKGTYGVVVYQEQVMEIIRQIAGLPYSTADKIRKVIGKKRDKKEFAPFKKAFIKGCNKVGAFSIDEAEEFWEGLQNHARYSFNKAHSIAYAMIAYWQQWLKHYYPIEFICTSLTYGPDKKERKQELIRDAHQGMGFIVIPPKVNISDGIKWVARDKKLYMPFKEIKGIGVASLPTIEKLIIKNDVGMRGFMDCDDEVKIHRSNNPKGVARILEDIHAFDKDSLVIPDGYIDYNVFSEPPLDLGIDLPPNPTVNPLSSCVKQTRIISPDGFSDCRECGLRRQARQVVPFSSGEYNVAIIAEAPGPDEDIVGEGLVGKSGTDILWPALDAQGFGRINFHVTNICKCYPSITKTPNKRQIEICSNSWLKYEIQALDCKIALVFGNTGVKCFTDRSGGIRKLSGSTEYIKDWDLHVYWCVHPSAVLRDPTNNKESFEKGIKFFCDMLHDICFDDIPF